MPKHYSCNGHVFIQDPNSVLGSGKDMNEQIRDVLACMDKYYMDENHEVLVPIVFKHPSVANQLCLAYRYLRHTPCGRSKYLMPCATLKQEDERETPVYKIGWVKIIAPHSTSAVLSSMEPSVLTPRLPELEEFVLVNSMPGAEHVIHRFASKVAKKLQLYLNLNEQDLESSERRNMVPVHHSLVSGHVHTWFTPQTAAEHGDHEEDQSLIFIPPMNAYFMDQNQKTKKKLNSAQTAYVKAQELIQFLENNPDLSMPSLEEKDEDNEFVGVQLLDNICSNIATRMAEKYELNDAVSYHHHKTHKPILIRESPAPTPTEGVFKPPPPAPPLPDLKKPTPKVIIPVKKPLPPSPLEKAKLKAIPVPEKKVPPPIPPKPIVKPPLPPKPKLPPSYTPTTPPKVTLPSSSKSAVGGAKSTISKGGKIVGKTTKDLGKGAGKYARDALNSPEGKEFTRFAGEVAHSSANTATAILTQALVEAVKDGTIALKDGTMYLARKFGKKTKYYTDKAKMAVQREKERRQGQGQDSNDFDEEKETSTTDDGNQTIETSLGTFIGVEAPANAEPSESTKGFKHPRFFLHCKYCNAPFLSSINQFDEEIRKQEKIGRYMTQHLANFLVYRSKMH